MARKGGPKPKKLTFRPADTKGESPQCPDWLDAEAKACWAEVVPQLDSMRVLRQADLGALAAYCDSWSRWKAAVLVIQRDGMTYQGVSGYQCPRPEVAIARSLLIVMNRYQQQFGLTPMGRRGIKGGVLPTVNPRAKFHAFIAERQTAQ